VGWRDALSRRLQRLGLDSLRRQILAFAVLAALIPAVTIAWLAYEQSKRSLVEKTTEELSATASQGARELGLWLKERLYDLRVYTGSYEVGENLERVTGPAGRAARARLTGYLDAVRGRTGDYELLAVTDGTGRVVTTSAGHPAGEARALGALPPEWQATIRQNGTVVGAAFWDSAAAKPVVTLAVPIAREDGRILGALAAMLSLASAVEVLSGFARNGSREAIVVTDSGRVVIRSHENASDLMAARLPASAFAALTAQPGEQVRYPGLSGPDVVGTLRPVPGARWSVVAQLPVEAAFAQVARLRNTAMGIVVVLVLGIGLLAYRLGLFVVGPLDRLTAGAKAVAGGDLAVEVPATEGGEMGYLARVFNDMVKRLRESRDELERLSITDPLTRLYNRRHLMTRLDEEGRRARRADRPFSLLIMDVDHFKRINDTYGHQAGDEVLAGVAAVLQESTREVDCAARYGGEEFVMLLPETPIAGALDVAERIRTRLAKETFPGGAITLSMGVAEFPADGETPEFMLHAADAALYRAKRDGRDRVTRAVRGRFSQDVKTLDPKSLRGSKGSRSSEGAGTAG
jgi:diguanylate cyclase (GGDEF)-like protein